MVSAVAVDPLSHSVSPNFSLTPTVRFRPWSASQDGEHVVQFLHPENFTKSGVAPPSALSIMSSRPPGPISPPGNGDSSLLALGADHHGARDGARRRNRDRRAGGGVRRVVIIIVASASACAGAEGLMHDCDVDRPGFGSYSMAPTWCAHARDARRSRGGPSPRLRRGTRRESAARGTDAVGVRGSVSCRRRANRGDVDRRGSEKDDDDRLEREGGGDADDRRTERWTTGARRGRWWCGGAATIPRGGVGASVDETDEGRGFSAGRRAAKARG